MLDLKLPKEIVKEEYVQKVQEGCVIPEDITNSYNGLKDIPTHEGWDVYEALWNLEPPEEMSKKEPTSYEEINSTLPKRTVFPIYKLTDEELYNKVYGAWLGRCSGCLLGAPVEGWSMDEIRNYCNAVDSYPLKTYVTYNEKGIKTKREIRDKHSTYGNISKMIRDDDTDYTLMNLLLLEKKGLDFTGRDVADMWLHHFAYTRIHLAQRAAYRNFTIDIWPPDSALVLNPWREMIGALIRADIFGYVAPGNPDIATKLAYEDAMVSHSKNGIYGEMFASALISFSFIAPNLTTAITGALEYIPAESRLAKAIRFSIDIAKEDISLDDKVREVQNKLESYKGAHVIPNACLDVIALISCENDFSKGITDVVMCGMDTDCNGATVGSVLGAFLGADALDSHWVEPLNDTLETFVMDYPEVNISDLAKRTCDMAKKIMHK